MSTATAPQGIFIPDEILIDKQLPPQAVLLYGRIPRMIEPEPDRRYFARAIDLAHVARTSLKTAVKALFDLERRGYVEIERREGYRGGYLIRFRRASALALMLSMLAFSGAEARQHSIRYSEIASESSQGDNTDYMTPGTGPRRKRRSNAILKRKKAIPGEPPNPESSFLSAYDRAGSDAPHIQLLT